MMFQACSELAGWAQMFAPLFSNRVWPCAQALLLGAIMAPGKRTVTSILRVLGLSGAADFQNYHRVLNRARWSGMEASRLLFQKMVEAFGSRGPLVLGLDETIERVGEDGSPRAAFIATRPAPANRSLIKPAGCAGSARNCWPACLGRMEFGLCPC